MNQKTLNALILFVQQTKHLLECLHVEKELHIDYTKLGLNEAADNLIETLISEETSI